MDDHKPHNRPDSHLATRLDTPTVSADVTEGPLLVAQLWLEAAGLRPTKQRVALGALLVGDGHHRHVTAETLFDAAAKTGEPVALATVYNTLRAFCEAGILQEITVDGSRSYFDTRMDDHPHFYWEEEAKLTDAPARDLAFARLPDAPEGTEVSKIDVVIRLRRT